tara:strand:+ start:877 stop:1104 length:228 start_codon:yes stop_codon:yes gene_type:complete
MVKKMFSRNISQMIITIAFFYSTLVCHLKAMEFFNNGENFIAFFLWFCAFTSFLGGLRFQLAKIINKLMKIKKND